MESILTCIKQLLGIEEDDITFDKELIVHINSAIAILTQLGVGPETGFKITGIDETWDQLTLGQADIEDCKSQIYFRCRLWFDPPQHSFAIDSIKKQCDEVEWRLEVAITDKKQNESI